ncbi:MAG: AAA family ATPase [Deltaproteobacteria bacterium]|nr:AAA family ATPase [Deltaproteobacteria bacterium]
MKKVDKKQIIKRIAFENPWWTSGSIDQDYAKMQSRAYLQLLYPLIEDQSVNRAVVLMGPRRVGKTVLIYHSIARLIAQGVSPKRIIYLSIDTPLFNGCALEELFELAREACEQEKPEGYFVFFDEIQYLKDWHVHLKRMVDSYRDCKFLASGSAAAALNRQSKESGAGRFTDFFLPPLTFSEFLSFLKKTSLVRSLEVSSEEEAVLFKVFKELNELFIDYINYGGFPEAVFSETIRKDPERFIRNDIIDKVLLRDLPSAYGTEDPIPEEDPSIEPDPLPDDPPAQDATDDGSQEDPNNPDGQDPATDPIN